MEIRFDDALSRFPKRRPPLPEAHRQRYVEDYRDNRSGRAGAVARRLEAWMHHRVALAGRGDCVLEIGAGTLNHLAFERPFRSYEVVEPFRELWEDSPMLDRVGAVYPDIRQVPLSRRYDRILSVAVLEHLTDLPFVLARCGQLMAEGATLAAGIPSEGSLAWYLAWRYGTGVPYRLRTGLDYAPLMRHEHVNTAAEIACIVTGLFQHVRMKRFPLPWLHASFYTVLIATNPDLERCGRVTSSENDDWTSGRRVGPGRS
jgi:SAM-dependent methyltransferase